MDACELRKLLEAAAKAEAMGVKQTNTRADYFELLAKANT